MTREQMVGLVTAITERVIGNGTDSPGCAPVKLRIGFIAEASNQVKGDGIVILDAPPAILDVVTQFIKDHQKDTGYTIFAQPGHGGLLIF